MNQSFIRIFFKRQGDISQKIENKDYPIDVTIHTQSDQILDLIQDKVDELKEDGLIPRRAMIQRIKVEPNDTNLIPHMNGRPLTMVLHEISDPLFFDVYVTQNAGGSRRKRKRSKSSRFRLFTKA